MKCFGNRIAVGILLGIAAGFSQFICGSQAARSIGFFIDEGSEYYDPKDKEQQGIKAITGEMLFALHQASFPMVVSATLWQNFIDRYNAFKPADQQSYEAMKRAANGTIAQVYRKIDAQDAQEHSESALNELNQYPFNLTLFKNRTAVKDTQFLAHETGFQMRAWSMYHIDRYFYLLVPQVYEQEIGSAGRSKTFSSSGISDREAVLGLRVDHLKPVQNPFKLSVQRDMTIAIPEGEETGTYLAGLLTKALQNLFVPAAQLEQANRSCVWDVYVTGHGSMTKMPADYDEKITAVAQMKERLADAKQKSQVDKRSYDKRVRELDDMVLRSEGAIAGLVPEAFTVLLRFLNSTIKTHLLYYNTCYGGGNHAVMPYLTHGAPLILNYTVVCGALIGAETQADVPDYHLPPYDSYDERVQQWAEQRDLYISGLFPYQVALTNGVLQLTYGAHIDFTRFFHDVALGKQSGRTLAQVANDVGTFMSAEMGRTKLTLANVPMVRYPGTENFRVIKVTEDGDNQKKKYVWQINDAKILKHQKEGSKPFLYGQPGVAMDQADDELVLVYPQYIPLTIELRGERLPHIVSMGSVPVNYFARVEVKDTSAFAALYFAFLPPGVGKIKPGKIALVQELSAAQSGFTDKAANILGVRGSRAVTLTDVTILKNVQDPMVPNSKKVVRVYFAYQNDCFTASVPPEGENGAPQADLFGDLRKLSAAQAKKYREWYAAEKQRALKPNSRSAAQVLKSATEWESSHETLQRVVTEAPRVPKGPAPANDSTVLPRQG